MGKNNDKITEISIRGVVDANKNPISIDDFIDKFIEWIEYNHWYFGGGIQEYKEDEETK